MAAEKLYHYVWHELADVILESSKPILAGEDALRQSLAARRPYFTCSKPVLVLLHPFMPFVTEEIWQSLPKKKTDLSHDCPWPVSAHAHAEVALYAFVGGILPALVWLHFLLKEDERCRNRAPLSSSHFLPACWQCLSCFRSNISPKRSLPSHHGTHPAPRPIHARPFVRVLGHPRLGHHRRNGEVCTRRAIRPPGDDRSTNLSTSSFICSPSRSDLQRLRTRSPRRAAHERQHHGFASLEQPRFMVATLLHVVHHLLSALACILLP